MSGLALYLSLKTKTAETESCLLEQDLLWSLEHICRLGMTPVSPLHVPRHTPFESLICTLPTVTVANSATLLASNACPSVCHLPVALAWKVWTPGNNLQWRGFWSSWNRGSKWDCRWGIWGSKGGFVEKLGSWNVALGVCRRFGRTSPLCSKIEGSRQNAYHGYIMSDVASFWKALGNVTQCLEL